MRLQSAVPAVLLLCLINVSVCEVSSLSGDLEDALKDVNNDLSEDDIIEEDGGNDGGVYHASEDLELTDEERDGKILVDVIASIAEWKDRQQRKLLHYLFHRQKRDEEVVCYGELGCFRDEGPFNYLDMLPSTPEEINTVFYLYTRKNDETPQLLDYLNNTSIASSNFNVSLATKFIIHGFGSSCSKIWPREMRLSFLLVEDVNVICVDWAAGAVDPNYVRAAVNTRLVGKQVAALIKKISSETGVDINNNTHLVGFSLGAHVSGFVGKELKNLSRITGLDPAGPLFEGYTPNVRLDKTDADFVDVIHSNGDSLIIGGLGAWEPIGHVDFYPNGGKAQRGCQNLLIGGLYDFIYSYSTKNESYRYLCNHRRAYKLFTDSISPKCKFTAFPCESYEKFESGQCFSCNAEAGECGHLGYRSNLSPGRGSLYLLTREDEPFCAAQFKIKMMFTGSRLPIHTYGALQIKLINKEGINETFTLTSTHDELLTSGAKIEKLIVAHPALSNPTEIQIIYMAYEGWIYSGRDVWSVEKLTLSDGYGETLSWCKEHGELLPKNIPVNIPLKQGECSSSAVVSLGAAETAKVPPVPPASPGGVASSASIPSGLTAPAPPSVKTSNMRPQAILTNDISKHSDVLADNIPTLPDSVPAHLNTIPRPVLLPVKPQLTVLPVKPTPPPLVQWGNKPGFNPRPPLQPYHLQGPPGAWNIVTSKPGSLPPPIHVYQSKLPTTHNEQGIEIQLGPRLPLPPLHPVHKQHFPARRRPSTKIETAKPADMSAADSVAIGSVLTRDQELPATERVDNVPETDIIVIETNQLKGTNTTEKPGHAVNDTGLVKTDLLSDDQLTIFKVGPDNDIVRVSNDTEDKDDNDASNNADNTDYKYVILHKLPNGDAINLENLKTYNYEDLIKGHSTVIEDANQEENFDRENLGMFDVPRVVSNDEKDPYIIYKLPESVRTAAQQQPVYRPNTVQSVQDIIKQSDSNQTLSNNTLTTNNSSDATTLANAANDDWIPRNRSEPELTLNTLSELSQLAQISINNNGPIKIQSSSASIPPKLNVQLLPPRLSAVLSHLDNTYRERDRSMERDRYSNSRSVVSPHRQNKISPAFQPQAREKARDRQYGRRIHNGDYLVTKPYQTQVIPSTKHRYIPLLHQQGKPLWWQPQDKQFQLPIRPHQLLHHPHSFNMVSKPAVNSLNSNQTSQFAKKNLTLALDNTKPPLVFNEKQSLLLGRINQVVHQSHPFYIIPSTLSSMNRTHAEPRVDMFTETRSGQNSSTVHLSSHISPTVSNLENKSQIFTPTPQSMTDNNLTKLSSASAGISNAQHSTTSSSSEGSHLNHSKIIETSSEETPLKNNPVPSTVSHIRIPQSTESPPKIDLKSSKVIFPKSSKQPSRPLVRNIPPSKLNPPHYNEEIVIIKELSANNESSDNPASG